ncbi:hypothetical protein Q0F99_00580 [Rathayibacter oskolensis]|uniref:hypothetical protein n=1 Tax=Rathayibacter TaxID=33886 RepID=UPI001315ED4F|nr:MULTISPECIES: hypothetical protein [Rathayibacter]QHC67154.1 hypothetical protein GSU68_11655 [Rathayibacter sp. VKM Ac-2759]WKK71745.1 hypothetical protein Q0F99_00580 [Rathayibacter oskolensis]
MSTPETRATLRRLSEVLEDPAPINHGHARYVRRLITSASLAEAPTWSGSGATEHIAAIAPDDAAEDPAL